MNLNEIIANYPTLDFDGVLGGVNEVVSLKSFHPKLATEKTLDIITKKIDGYAQKLATAVLDASHTGKIRVLDFVIKQGEWNSFMPQIKLYIRNLQESTYPNITIRVTEF